MFSLAAALVAASIQSAPLPAPEPVMSPSLRLFQGNNAGDEDDGKARKRRQDRKAAPQSSPPKDRPPLPKPSGTPEKRN